MTTITTKIDTRKQIEDNEHKWYVLSVVSGQESLVVENLIERIKKQSLTEDVIDYLVPMINKTHMKKNEKVIRPQKLYPGYVFIKSRMNDKIWYVVRNTPGVRIIVGAETHPIPLSEQEYQNMVTQIEAANSRSELVIPYQEGDIVLMKDGDFSGMQWTIKEINLEQSCAVVNVEMLGRLTPVMIDFNKIELVN